MSAIKLNNFSDIKPNVIESVNTTQEKTDIERQNFQRLYTKFQSSKNSSKVYPCEKKKKHSVFQFYCAAGLRKVILRHLQILEVEGVCRK